MMELVECVAGYQECDFWSLRTLASLLLLLLLHLLHPMNHFLLLRILPLLLHSHHLDLMNCNGLPLNPKLPLLVTGLVFVLSQPSWDLGLFWSAVRQPAVRIRQETDCLKRINRCSAWRSPFLLRPISLKL